jgi:energy-coupling factor transport system permease protein
MEKGIRFDPRTKFILLFGVNLLLLLSRSLVLEVALFSFCICILVVDAKYKDAIMYVIAFLFMLFTDRYLCVFLTGFYGTIINFIVYALRRFMPCLILGKWILDTTAVSDFVATMWKIRLPLTVIIPLSVVFRYFPTIKEEWNSIRDAMKIRGISFSMEHVLVPLIFSAVNVSEELSAAALCRGLDAPGEHTSYIEIKMSAIDYLFLLILAGMAVAAFTGKAMGVI